MRVLILGNGYIGNKYYRHFKNAVLSKNRINNFNDACYELERHDCDVVINCIGRTGSPNIDWCEDNKDITVSSNVLVPLYIEKACHIRNVKMVHLSTGCIYQGSSRFHEDDRPNFDMGVYANSKYMVERILKYNVLQLRIRMPIDGCRNERNLLNKLIRYEKTINVENSITVIPDLMTVTEKLIRKDACGVFNVVNPVPVTHKQIIDIYNTYSNRMKIFREISVKELDKMTIAKRSNCTLSTVRLNGYGVYMPDTIESLHKCIKEYVNEESEAIL